MSFIPNNPLTIPEVELPSSVPKPGTRGLIAMPDGWYDVDSDGNMKKIANEIDGDFQKLPQPRGIISDTIINTLNDGWYFVTSKATGLPIKDGRNWYLESITYRDRFQFMRIIHERTRSEYTTLIDINNIPEELSWTELAGTKVEKTDFDILSNSVSQYRGVLSDGSININTLKEGLYIVQENVNDLPKNAPKGNPYLINHIYNNRFVLRTLIYNNGTQFQSFYDSKNAVANDWIEITNIQLSNQNEKLVFMGDSIFALPFDPEKEENTIPAKVAHYLQIPKCNYYNCSFGGTSAASRGNEKWDAFALYKLADSIVSGDFSLQETHKKSPNIPNYFPDRLNCLSGIYDSEGNKLEEPKPLDFSSVNRLFITIGGNDWAQNISLSRELSAIEVVAPTTTTYTVGDTLDTAGMKVTANYSDGSTADVTAEAVVDTTTLATAGTVTVTVTYADKSTTFDIKVNSFTFDNLSSDYIGRIDIADAGSWWTFNQTSGLLVVGSDSHDGFIPSYNPQSGDYAPWYDYEDTEKDITISHESIKKVIITNNLKIIGKGAFYGCTNITDVTIHSNLKTPSISNYAFYGCTSLTSITIPDGATSIGTNAFGNCTSLTSVTIPDSVETIGERAFQNCTSLTSITIPESVTSIGSYAFYGCTGLTSVTIPKSVTSIGKFAFYGCTGLTSAKFKNNKTQMGGSVFGQCDNRFKICVSAYDKDTPIGTYINDNNIEFIELTGTNRNIPMLMDTKTFIGALNYFIDKMQTKFPNLRIYLLPAPMKFTLDESEYEESDNKLYKVIGDSDTYENNKGNILKDFVDALIQCAKDNHIPIIDIHNDVGINKYNWKEFHNSNDGSHFSAKGADKVGRFIASAIKGMQ